MCGFTGFWEFSKRYSSIPINHTVKKMSSLLEKRGPDFYGTWHDEKNRIAFGHRRLAIIDLSPSGNQPMTSKSGQYVIIYNGEIYNSIEIRKKLISNGVVFKGTSDTEVLLEAIETWGIEHAIKNTIGMFAFALWDKNKKKLYLVRDRIGIKPLYWGFNKGILFFGSQIKSFIAHPKWNPEISHDSLISFFQLNYVPTPSSIFKKINKLTPGYILTINSKKETALNKYWCLADIIKKRKILSHSKSTIINDLNNLLSDATKKRMIADVPIGAFLSGGIDSSLIVSLMQKLNSKPIKTFSIGFYEQKYNEAKKSKAIAKFLGTDHHELYLNANDILNIIPNIPDWYDEPFADSSQIPTYLISNMARNNVTVCLSGDGGDELFAGYNRYRFINTIWPKIQCCPNIIKSILSKILSMNSSKQLIKLFSKDFSHQNSENKIHKFINALSATNIDEIYKILISNYYHPKKLVTKGKEFINQTNYDFIQNQTEQILFLDTLNYLPDDILTKVDRASMASSLEVRVPFLDHRIVEFAWSLPLNMKINNKNQKLILREILNKYVPKQFTNQPKMGFSIPINQWLNGPLKDWAEDLLSEKQLKEDGLLNYNFISKKWKEHSMGKRNWEYLIWSVLMFQSWKKTYINK